jgi:hypothetical protein
MGAASSIHHRIINRPHPHFDRRHGDGKGSGKCRSHVVPMILTERFP